MVNNITEEYNDRGSTDDHPPAQWMYDTIHQTPESLPALHPHWNENMLIRLFNSEAEESFDGDNSLAITLVLKDSEVPVNWDQLKSLYEI